MIKKKTTTIELVCTDERTGEEVFVTYKGGDEDQIKIKTKETEYKWFSFTTLSEIVSAIDRHKTNSPEFRTPVIIDHRKEDETKIEKLMNSVSRDPAAEKLSAEAAKIQEQVEDTMSRMSSSDAPVMSFVKQGDAEQEVSDLPAPPELEIDNEDPVGIPPEAIERLGEVPETPEQFRRQLQEIQQQRAGTKLKKNPEKRIKRRDGDGV